jgi:predicted transcriptional regulator of viral defense system
MARIARAQYGLATRRQLLAAGLSPTQIVDRVGRGALIRVHRGVYGVGHAPAAVEARYLAAVLACGDGAVLSGQAAGHLLGILKRPPRRPEVTTTTERRVAGVRTTRTRGLDARDRTTWRAIPVTSPARTLVDLAAVLALDALARACHEAGVLHRTTPAHVTEALCRRPNAAGAARLRRVLSGEVRVTLSVLERRFLDVLRAARLPLPQTNRPAGTRRVDCRWPERRLTIELDSYRFHSSRHAWEQDRLREREAYARGDDFRRFTYGDVTDDPRAMLAELRALLAIRV